MGAFRVAVLSAALGTVLAGRPAWAGPAEDRAKERTRYATSQYNLGHYDDAAAAYEEAYTQVPDPSLLYNIGQAYRLAGKPDRALVAYRSYLRSAPLGAPARAQVEERVSELERLVADQRRTQSAPPTGPTPHGGGEAGWPPPPPPRAPPGTGPYNDGSERGWFIGGGLVGGSLRTDCSTCGQAQQAGGGELHVGLFLRPRLALVADGWDMVYSSPFLQVNQGILVGGVQWWASEKLWLRGGVGFAQAGYRWSGLGAKQDQTESRPGVMAAVGYDAYRYQRFVFDLELRYGTGFYSGAARDGYVVKAHSAGLGVAVSWY